jgi:hypothetical protein
LEDVASTNRSRGTAHCCASSSTSSNPEDATGSFARSGEHLFGNSDSDLQTGKLSQMKTWPIWREAGRLALRSLRDPSNPSTRTAMSIFSNILAKIFPPSHPAVVATQGAPTSTTGGAAATPAAPAAAAPPAAPVDVDAVVSAMPGAAQLNWKTSIVDLMKVLNLDSSLESRKQLAQELGYTGSTTDSAQMNIWLHKEVMAKLAANGGKVPADLKD